MAEDRMKLPFGSIEIPKPKKWDLIAFAAVGAAGALAAFNLASSQSQPPGVSLSGGFTLIIVLAQLAVSSASLLILGKTAKEGTIWGNLASVAGMLAGLTGVLLAAALWTAA